MSKKVVLGFSGGLDTTYCVKYLTEEKLKVGKVKEAIIGSLAKADSLLKTNL